MVSATNLRQTSSKQAPLCCVCESARCCSVRRGAGGGRCTVVVPRLSLAIVESRGGAGPGSAAPPVPVVHRRATRVRAPMKYRPYRPDHVAQQAKVDTAPGYFNLFNTWLAPRQPQHAWTSITMRPSRRRAASCRRRQSRKASDVKEPARGHPAWSSAGADSARRQAGCCHRHYRS